MMSEGLARISHQLSATAADPGMSAALRSAGFLDVLSRTPAESSCRAGKKAADTPCSHARRRRLATKSGETCGLDAGVENEKLLGTLPNGAAESRPYEI